MVILGKLPLKKFPVYVLAQFLGAFAGSCAVYGLYYGGCKCVNIITPRELSSRITRLSKKLFCGTQSSLKLWLKSYLVILPQECFPCYIWILFLCRAYSLTKLLVLEDLVCIIAWTVNDLYCVFCFTDALMEYTNGEFVVTGVNATANIFASYPAKHLSVLNGFVDQVGFHTNFKMMCKENVLWNIPMSDNDNKA